MWIGHFYGTVSIVFYWQPAKEIHRTFIKLIGICCVNGRELIGDMLKGRRKKAAAVQDRRNNLTPPKPFVTFNCPWSITALAWKKQAAAPPDWIFSARL
jgi:hypothetical protein